jgi:hypothetical protein
MAHIFETIMLVSFGISWPTSILKSYTSRTAKGKSLIFLIFILIGYIFGVIAKFVGNDVTYVVVFYIINFIMVFIDLCMYFRNRRLDAERELH